MPPYFSGASISPWVPSIRLTAATTVASKLEPFLHHGANVCAAHLSREVSVPWTHMNAYFGENDTAADELWEDISIDKGTVALEDSYVRRVGLPRAQRFPWDENKGLYLLNGFHSMHCLVRLKRARKIEQYYSKQI